MRAFFHSALSFSGLLLFASAASASVLGPVCPLIVKPVFRHVMDPASFGFWTCVFWALVLLLATCFIFIGGRLFRSLRSSFRKNGELVLQTASLSAVAPLTNKWRWSDVDTFYFFVFGIFSALGAFLLLVGRVVVSDGVCAPGWHPTPRPPAWTPANIVGPVNLSVLSPDSIYVWGIFFYATCCLFRVIWLIACLAKPMALPPTQFDARRRTRAVVEAWVVFLLGLFLFFGGYGMWTDTSPHCTDSNAHECVVRHRH